ncbi:hypothetical protein GOP47_0023716 [Adiantum capillus-veneris]|uniref:ABC transporter domain-containing protein n=1 Tax=Adiantum capillus-veneris TaxID=13818 RepID=A0A9D4Z668_ADICA|nr:hypothetical protein GOP47_0023716 [Adiantum capillus-veneris]
MRFCFNPAVMATVGDDYSVQVSGLQFSYPGQAPFIADFNLQLKPGSRCLLVGANGSGKTTLLRILAGKHMWPACLSWRLLEQDSWLCWRNTLAGGLFSRAHDLWSAVEGADPSRREQLIGLLDIDLEWRMHKVSDGQRRRVQICMGLLQLYKVLLLDEITVDLDVVARMDLLSFFVTECEERGATVVYATHIFDGLETWATHLAHVEDGKLKGLYKMNEIPELCAVGKSKTLLQVVESWLRKEREAQLLREKDELSRPTKPLVTSPWASSRHMAYYR